MWKNTAIWDPLHHEVAELGNPEQGDICFTQQSDSIDEKLSTVVCDGGDGVLRCFVPQVQGVLLVSLTSQVVPNGVQLGLDLDIALAAEQDSIGQMQFPRKLLNSVLWLVVEHPLLLLGWLCERKEKMKSTFQKTQACAHRSLDAGPRRPRVGPQTAQTAPLQQHQQCLRHKLPQ